MGTSPHHVTQRAKPSWNATPIIIAVIFAVLAGYVVEKHGKATMKGPEGIEIIVDAKEAAALTQKADAQAVSSGVRNPSPDAPKIDATVISQQFNPMSNMLPLGKVLWVDDHPINNQAERLALAALGIYCDSYTNTREAIAALKWNSQNGAKPYDVIVSDYKRDNEKDVAGTLFTGLDTYHEVRELSGYRNTAFVFYTADGLEAVQSAVSADSNAASTNYPDVLLHRVLQAIKKPANP